MPGSHAHDDDFLFEAQRSDRIKAPNRTETNRVKETKRKPTHHDDFLYEEQREKKKAKTA
jgi:hypothetical protein